MTSQVVMRVLFQIINKVMHVKPFQVDTIIKEGYQIVSFSVLDVPGHTPGRIALYNPNRKVLFIGDTLGYKNGVIYEPSKNVSTKIMQAYRSIEKLKNIDFSIMLSGHGQTLMSQASSRT